MRKYMCGSHRRILEQLDRRANIRSYATEHAADSPLRKAYNDSALTLCAFSDYHLQLVARYIMLAAKKETGATGAGSSSFTTKQAKLPEEKLINLATVTEKKTPSSLRGSSSHADEYYGTGGTDLLPFLKQTRDTTRAAAMGH